MVLITSIRGITIGQNRTNVVASSSNGGLDGKIVPPIVTKPHPYTPPPMANKGGIESNWRQPETMLEMLVYTENSPKQEGVSMSLPNNAANQQCRNEVADLGRLIMQNAQPSTHPIFRITY